MLFLHVKDRNAARERPINLHLKDRYYIVIFARERPMIYER